MMAYYLYRTSSTPNPTLQPTENPFLEYADVADDDDVPAAYCPCGYFTNASVLCQICPRGTYIPQYGETKVCYTCPEFYTSTEGSCTCWKDATKNSLIFFLSFTKIWTASNSHKYFFAAFLFMAVFILLLPYHRRTYTQLNNSPIYHAYSPSQKTGIEVRNYSATELF